MKIGNWARAAVSCAVLGLSGCDSVPPHATVASDAEGYYLPAVGVDGYLPGERQVTRAEGRMVDGRFVSNFL